MYNSLDYTATGTSLAHLLEGLSLDANKLDRLSARERELLGKLLELVPEIHTTISQIMPNFEYRMDKCLHAIAVCTAAHGPTIAKWKISEAEDVLIYRAVELIVKSRVAEGYEAVDMWFND